MGGTCPPCPPPPPLPTPVLNTPAWIRLKPSHIFNPPSWNDPATQAPRVNGLRSDSASGSMAYRCHYTKSKPIDDHSNIFSKKLQKQNFKPSGHYTCMQCGTSHLQTVQENILSHIIFRDLQEVYSGNRQIHIKCQLQYLHPPHISTSGKCHCVIIHQTTKATEYIG